MIKLSGSYLSEIGELEDSLNKLFPPHQIKKRPSKELLDAISAWSEAVWEAGENLGACSLSSEQILAAKELIKHPVFICGVHRSGTTLIRDLLDGHPSLTVLPSEGSYLTNLTTVLKQMREKEARIFMGTEWLRRLANPINQPPYWLLGRSSSEESLYVQFVRQFLAWWPINNSKSFWPILSVVLAYASVRNEITAKYWVDKTPTNERYLKKIWKEMPQARIIHIIRDPQDIFISRKFMAPWLDIRTFLHDMERSFKVAREQSQRNESRYLLLKYEELCEKPDNVAERIAMFLDIKNTPGLLRPTVAGRPSIANSSFKKAWIEGRILNAAENKSDELLSAREYDLLSAHVGGLAAMFGYPMRHSGIWKSSMLKLKYLFP